MRSFVSIATYIMSKDKLSNEEERVTQNPSTGAARRAFHSRIEETILGELESLDPSARSLPDSLQ